MIKQFIFSILLAFGLTLQAQTTFTSFDEVTETSLDTNKPILLIFQGSDWCAPCIKFERNIWSTPTFQSYAEENLLIVKADFPRRKSNQQKNNPKTNEDIKKEELIDNPKTGWWDE